MAIAINGSGTITGISAGGLPDDTVDNGTMADDAIDSAEIANGAVDLAHLSATGTASSSTYLRGDNSWVAVSGGVDSDAYSNTVAGSNAGDSFTSGSALNNSCFGKNAGTAISTGDHNTFIGKEAGKALTTGSGNTAVGTTAFLTSTGSSNNTAIGKDALGLLTGGADNVAIGAGAGYAETDGNRNVFIGVQAGDGMENRSDNVAIGYQALTHTGAKNRNVCVGAYAGLNNQNDENVFVGYQAGQGCTSGYYNTCMGHNAGYNLSTGIINLLLGFNAGTAGSPSGVVDDESTTICLGSDHITDLYCNDTSISSSDQRDKTDIANFTAGLSFIKQLRPVTYRWDKRSWYTTEKVVTQAQIDNEEYEQGQLGNSIPATAADVMAATPDGSKKSSRQHLGFLAQEVLAVEQSAGFASDRNNMLTVNLTKDETQYGMKYERLVPILVNAIKELETRIATLEAA